MLKMKENLPIIISRILILCNIDELNYINATTMLKTLIISFTFFKKKKE